MPKAKREKRDCDDCEYRTRTRLTPDILIHHLMIVWHGGMNLLGKEDAWDNLIRVKDAKAASELLALEHV